MWLWFEFWCLIMDINIWLILFIVTINGNIEDSIEYETMEQCLGFEQMVSKKPSLVTQGKMVESLQFGCVKYIRRYVEECEVVPMDYVNKKDCIPYWEHYGKNSRR